MHYAIKFIILLAVVAFATACSVSADTDERQAAATERLAADANVKVGIPGIINYTEKRNAKMILELRDKELPTFTYIIDFNGGLHFLCASIGYGLPYSVQFTNPLREEWVYNGAIALPQADPNQLFMPDGLDATWVLCSDGEGGVRPVYSEPKLVVSPFELASVGAYLEK